MCVVVLYNNTKNLPLPETPEDLPASCVIFILSEDLTDLVELNYFAGTCIVDEITIGMSGLLTGVSLTVISWTFVERYFLRFL